MSNMIWLSHTFSDQVPTFGGTFAPLHFEQKKNQSCGDSCNTFDFTLHNHWGTHIDAPAHFFSGEKKLAEYTPQDFIFHKVQLIDWPLEKAELITPHHLKDLKPEIELLLFKSHFEKFRTSTEYGEWGPGVTVEAGLWLRKNFPKLKMIGFDFISLSSFQHRTEGRLSHQAFLNPHAEGQPILIIEDMTLKELRATPNEVIIAPWRISSMDSAPCTVIAKMS